MDPYKQYASPYLGMGNSPVNGVDPDGGLFGLGAVGSTLAGAGIGAALGAGVGLIADEDNWGYYAAAGALIGGAIGYKSVPGDPRRPPIGGQGGPLGNEAPTIDAPGSKIGRFEQAGGRKETLSIPEERKIPKTKPQTSKPKSGQDKNTSTSPVPWPEASNGQDRNIRPELATLNGVRIPSSSKTVRQAKGGYGNWIGPGLFLSGLPVIPKSVVPKSLMGRFAQGSRMTSLSSIFFRNTIPSNWRRLSFLPKSTSLGGQLGRVTMAAGFYTTIIQISIENWKNATPQERYNWSHTTPGGFYHHQ